MPSSVTYSDRAIARIVKYRLARRRKLKYSTLWGKARECQDAERIGVSGEVAFAERYGIAIDESEKANGDGGIDFVTKAGTVDVKTYRSNPHEFWLRKDKPKPEIIVFGKCFTKEGYRAILVGWVRMEDVREKCEVRDDENGGKHKNYVIPRDMLRSMQELDEMILGEGEEANENDIHESKAVGGYEAQGEGASVAAGEGSHDDDEARAMG